MHAPQSAASQGYCGLRFRRRSLSRDLTLRKRREFVSHRWALVRVSDFEGCGHLPPQPIGIPTYRWYSPRRSHDIEAHELRTQHGPVLLYRHRREELRRMVSTDRPEPERGSLFERGRESDTHPHALHVHVPQEGVIQVAV